MVWQSIMVVLLGCTLAGNTLTSAITFPRPVARKRSDFSEGEELLRALEFLERYEGVRQPELFDNRIDTGYPPIGKDYDDFVLPYDPSLTLVDGNGLPPPPFSPQDYPMEEPLGDPYDFMFNTAIDEPVGDRLTIGQRIEQNAAINGLLNRMFEDAVVEEMLREDAEEAAKLLEEDVEEDEEDEDFASYGSQLDIDYGVLDDDYDDIIPEDSYENLDEEDYPDYSSNEGDEVEINKNLLESVILRLAEGEMQEGLDDTTEDSELDSSQDYNEDYEEGEEVDDFVAKIMSELLEGSEDLANKLIDEIDEEKELLEEEDILELVQEEDPLERVVFSDGWDDPAEEYIQNDVDLDFTCPALDYILDDCMIADEFPGLGSEGYKEGFGESCNRHQLCYFCSGTYDIPTKLCDETYKMELMSICNDDPECDFRAKYFWLSAIASRAPSSVAVSVCQEPCVIAYLLNY